MKRVALIDGDSISYILGWTNKDNEDTEMMEKYVESFIGGILNAVDATHYIGALGSSAQCFRYSNYKYKPYKGTRPPKPDWIRFWQPIIEDILKEKWGFRSWYAVEADDVVCMAAEELALGDTDYVICSPDKDLKQIPGKHFDYKKGTHQLVSPDEAEYNFYYQMLVGDDSDNIAGCPKVGPVKAKQLLTPAMGSRVEMEMIVEKCFKDYFCEYYGTVIMEETRNAVEMLHTGHALYKIYGGTMNFTTSSWLREKKELSIDERILKAIGWQEN